MKSFDSLTIELAGRNLIEASAGTGKTYAITALYVRLLVEQGLLPENILVVTFTEAATKELRDRIRQRLRDVRDIFAGIPGSDELGHALLRAADAGAPWGGEALPRLEAALQTFDCAAIATIHGFCNRALQENAFESGSLYDTELTAQQEPLILGLVEDFWRTTLFGEATELIQLVVAAKWTPESLAKFLRGKLANPELKIVPCFSSAEVAQCTDACRRLFAELQAVWRQRRQEIVTLLAGHEGLRRSAVTYRADVLTGLVTELESFLDGDSPYRLFSGFERFTAGFIDRQRLAKKEPPNDPFFEQCAALDAAVNRQKLALLWSLYDYVASRLPRRKAQVNLRFYDDLLTDLLAALQGGSGGQLAAQIRGRYRAALIDEFQDTDQIQYRIFQAIFDDDTLPLFLIGDPKQAIYSFRGADVFAYLGAKADIPEQRRFSMAQNWRSTPQLVEGVNLLFNRSRQPLLLAGLDFPPVTAAAAGQRLFLGDCDPAPLQLWFMGREAGNNKPLDLNRVRPRIVAAVAAEIAVLLTAASAGRATLGDRPLTPGDIAVIVRSHGQAAQVHAALAGYGIAAVVRSNACIFASAEAAELCTLLGALAEPAREERVRSALATTLLGVSGNEIARLLTEAAALEWEQRLAAFRDYHDLWRLHGFMVMFRRLLAAEGVRGRLLSLPGGERRLTNLLHCGELLHSRENAARLGCDALCTWFCHQVSSPPEGEEYQIRLESDEQAVRILTIHVSKGLEFPVVFAPFSWGGVLDNEETVVCHEEGRLVADYGSENLERHRHLARQESLAENLRLLYVALTRAQYRCYLVWGRFRQSESSALAYLLHGDAGGEAHDILAELASSLDSVDDAALLAPLQSLVAAGRGALALTIDPAEAAIPVITAPLPPPALSCGESERRLDDGWQVSSFTAFAGGHKEAAELPDHDEQQGSEMRPAETAPAEGSIFAFPRGARAGTFLHGILEKLDFATADPAAISSLVGAALGRSTFGAKWHGPLCTLVRQTLSVPLAGGAATFTLADLGRNSWQTEMEFYFPLQFIGSRSLAAVLQRHAASNRGDLAKVAAMLDFREVHGMVRGFVDLVFRHEGRYYLLDWKSNHLGNRLEDYGQEQLSRAMSSHLYPLQYLLYTVALDRYLRLRDPAYRYEEHFGGVFYLFLRGIEATRPEYGVFHAIPAAALVEELTATLVACEGA